MSILNQAVVLSVRCKDVHGLWVYPVTHTLPLYGAVSLIEEPMGSLRLQGKVKQDLLFELNWKHEMAQIQVLARVRNRIVVLDVVDSSCSDLALGAETQDAVGSMLELLDLEEEKRILQYKHLRGLLREDREGDW